MKNSLYLAHLMILLFLFFINGCDCPLSSEYTLTVEIKGEGVVSPSVGKYRFDRDESVTISAKSANVWLWAFKEWEGDVPASQSKSPEAQILMDSNKTVIAVFTDILEFEDSQLEEIVREILGIDEEDIYLDEARDIYELSAHNRNITSLDGIQYFQNLKVLNIRSNQIRDLSPLEQLTRLESLAFWDNRVESIDPLRRLTSLISLSFWKNNVRDLTPLRDLVRLERLIFEDNRVESLAGLEKLTSLEWLWFKNNQVRDISVLENLTKLNLLYFPSNYVEDIGPLVRNNGLGYGDDIDMAYNSLDLTEGSQNMRDIQALLDRGVGVGYSPQRQNRLLSISNGEQTLTQWNLEDLWLEIKKREFSIDG